MRSPLYEFRVRRVRRSWAAEAPTFNQAHDVAGMFRGAVAGEAREVFMCASLDVRNRVIGVELVATGCLAGVEVHPRELFRAAILAGAAAIVVAHNHPSGDPSPSPQDIALTERIRDAGRLIGIPLIDHVIITDDDHCSLAERSFQ